MNKRETDIVPQPEAGKNEKYFPTRRLREPKGIRNGDRTKQKLLIGKSKAAVIAQQDEGDLSNQLVNQLTHF